MASGLPPSGRGSPFRNAEAASRWAAKSAPSPCPGMMSSRRSASWGWYF